MALFRSKHYCPNSDNHKHHYVNHHSKTKKDGSKHPKAVTIHYCKDCGFTDHKKGGF